MVIRKAIGAMASRTEHAILAGMLSDSIIQMMTARAFGGRPYSMMRIL